MKWKRVGMQVRDHPVWQARVARRLPEGEGRRNRLRHKRVTPKIV